MWVEMQSDTRWDKVDLHMEMERVATMSLAPIQEAPDLYDDMSELLGRKIRSETDVVRIAREGVSVRSLRRLSQRLGIRENAIVPETTLRRREEGKQVLTLEETERLMRLARVYSQAKGLYGDAKAALQWLHAPEDFLDDGKPVTPLELASTDAGARMVEGMILRTAYGFVF